MSILVGRSPSPSRTRVTARIFVFETLPVGSKNSPLRKKVVTLCNLVWLQVTTGNKDIDRFVTVAVVSEPVDSPVEGGEKPRQGRHVASRPVAIHHGAILWQVSDVIRGPSNDAEAGGDAIEVERRRQYCGIYRA